MLFRRWRRRTTEAVTEILGQGEILALDDSANFFGVESRGARQLRGNGCLGASEDEIAFVMWIPRRVLRIPRASVTAIERTRWHLGKTIVQDLLKVRFQNQQGLPDSVAWYVRDLPMWEAVLAS